MSTNSALIRLPAVLGMTGLGRTMWLDLVKEGKAPKPIKIGAAAMWQHEEVQAWIQARIRAHRGQALSSAPAPIQPAQAAPPKAEKKAPPRLLRTYDQVDTGSLEDMIYLAALNVEDAMLTGGLTPGADYTALDLFKLGMPIALEMYRADGDASYVVGGHPPHRSKG